MDGNTPIYSIAVPTNLLSDRNISATAKLLYGVIDSFQRKSGVCYASNDRLSEEIAGCSARTISRAIAELKEAGYIDVDDEKGRSIYISTSISGGLEGRQKCLPLLEEPHAPHDKIGEGGSQNCLPSNTVSKKEKNKKEKPQQLTDEELRPLVVSGINGLAQENWGAAVKNDLFRWVMALYDPNRTVRKAHPVRSKLSVDATFRKLAQSGKDPQVMINMLCTAIEGGWQGVQVPSKGKAAAAKPHQEEREYRCL